MFTERIGELLRRTGFVLELFGYRLCDIWSMCNEGKLCTRMRAHVCYASAVLIREKNRKVPLSYDYSSNRLRKNLEFSFKKNSSLTNETIAFLYETCSDIFCTELVIWFSPIFLLSYFSFFFCVGRFPFLALLFCSPSKNMPTTEWRLSHMGSSFFSSLFSSPLRPPPPDIPQ